MKKIVSIFTFVLGFVFVYAQAPTSRDWHMLDLSKDNIPGVSVNRTYEELLKGRKSKPVIVAVIDSGVDYGHEDLREIMYVNEDEIPNNDIDDDKNGYIDDIFGWNFIGGKTGNNVDLDNLEVARVYKSLNYKYSKANPDVLNKTQKKEYEEYLKVKDEIEKERVKAAEAVDKFNTMKQESLRAIEVVNNSLAKRGLTLDQLDSLNYIDEEIIKMGVKTIKGFREADPNINTYERLVQAVGEEFKRPLDYYSEKVKFHYNPEYNSRYIVADNYEDATERFYGNKDAKGPDPTHGTHVAGIIASKRFNNIGMDGIADNAKIMSIRVVPNGDERDKDVANAIRYAADNGAKIINMSFGKNYKWDKKVVDKAVKYANKKGVLLIHAAGNNGENNDEIIHYPSDKYEDPGFFSKKYAKNWIEVGASSFKNDSLFVAKFSNYGKMDVDVFAPGVAIYSTVPGNKYDSFNGTSMATPVVAGIAAVLKSYFPGLKAGEIKDIILESSVKKDLSVKRPGDKKLVKFSELSNTGGEVNLYNAVLLAIQKYSDKAAM
jgi:subtilisin family serine protease